MNKKATEEEKREAHNEEQRVLEEQNTTYYCIGCKKSYSLSEIKDFKTLESRTDRPIGGYPKEILWGLCEQCKEKHSNIEVIKRCQVCGDEPSENDRARFQKKTTHVLLKDGKAIVKVKCVECERNMLP